MTIDEFDPATVNIPRGNFVEGTSVPGTGVAVGVVRPSDGMLYADFMGSTAADVDAAVDSAYRAFKDSEWSRMAPRHRARILHRWADLIQADADVMGRLECVGSTRSLRDVCSWDLPFTAEGIHFFAELADKHGGEVAATQRDHLGLVIAEPYGVVGAIAPWNFPLVMASWKVAPALAAGNTVVLKPSELTPFSVLRFAELAMQAGIPAGVFNVVLGDGREAGDALCRHPKISKVTFTGSTQTGTAIMRACAESGPKPVTLELGGKSPQLIFADAPNLGNVVQMVARAITANAGQVCVAGSRLVVQDTVADQLIDSVAAIFRALRPGPTWRIDSTLPPIVSWQQCRNIADTVQRSIDAGAQVVTGGRSTAAFKEGAYFQPTILTSVTNETDAVKHEIFGPVVTAQTFHDDDEGLALASHDTYGLAAGVHTSDLGRAMRMIRRLEAGTVWVNRYGRTDDFILPTGGFKQSGIGKDLGRQAFEANLRHKAVLIDFSE